MGGDANVLHFKKSRRPTNKFDRASDRVGTAFELHFPLSHMHDANSSVRMIKSMLTRVRRTSQDGTRRKFQPLLRWELRVRFRTPLAYYHAWFLWLQQQASNAPKARALSQRFLTPGLCTCYISASGLACLPRNTFFFSTAACDVCIVPPATSNTQGINWHNALDYKGDCCETMARPW